MQDQPGKAEGVRRRAPLPRRRAEAQVALMLLTRLPAGRLAGAAPGLAEARWAYPLAGLVAGTLGWAAWWAATGGLGLSPMLGALVAVLAGILATGALHEDGLADLADGLGGGRDRARKLEIMRDSRIGSYGALALIGSVGLRVLAIAALPTAALPALWAFLAVAAGSRAAMVAALEALPGARDDGLGHMAAAARGGWRGPAAAGLALAALVPLGWALGPGAALAVAAGMAAAGAVPAILARRQIGGQTGDVLGAVQQAAEAGGWIALAAVLGG